MQEGQKDNSPLETKREDSVNSLSQNSLNQITCPITRQIFYKPVTVDGCGHAFEKEAISEYIKVKTQSHEPCSCPMCRNPIRTLSPSPLITELVETRIKKHPSLQNQQYFTIQNLSRMLKDKNMIELKKLCSILKTSHYLNAISTEDEYQGSTALTELTAYFIGRSILYKDPNLQQCISEEGFNAILETGDYKGTSAVFWMSMDPSWHERFVLDKTLRAKISSKGLNSICQNGPLRGQSALIHFAGCFTGRMLLLHTNLTELINIETLMHVIPDGKLKGLSAYQCLDNTEEGKKILNRNPRLKAEIDRWHHTHAEGDNMSESEDQQSITNLSM